MQIRKKKFKASNENYTRWGCPKSRTRDDQGAKLLRGENENEKQVKLTNYMKVKVPVGFICEGKNTT